MHEHWLFAANALSHWVASMSSIVSFTLGIVELVRNKKIESWIFFAIAGLFLIVGFDQAWQDEHHNAELVKIEKSAAISESNLLKQQSVEKDAAIRTRDGLLENDNAAIAASQTSFANLANKILDITKPEPLKITVAGERLPYYGGTQPHEMMMLAFPNKVVGQVNAVVKCDKEISSARAAMLGHDLWTGQGVSIEGANRFFVNITSPTWSPTQPLVIYIAFKSELPKVCTVAQQ